MSSNRVKTTRKRQLPPAMPASNGHGYVFAPPRNRHGLQKLNLSGMRTPEPDTSNEDNINSLEYVRKYLSNTLVLPPNEEQHEFVRDHLQQMELLGNGSFGVVHKMLHRPTSIEMAVKKITLINNGPDDAFNKSMYRFRQEVEATKAASNCTEIVKYYGITFHEGDAWMCMELMDLSLDKLYMISHDIVKTIIPEEVLGAVAVATIRALEHLKTTHHIIHRDIKPSNILLDKQGCVKLCDFGICGYLQNSVAQSVDVGCRPYMAPERLAPNGDGYDIKSEVWSLGITMVEVANGKYPYDGFLNAPILEQVRMVVYGDPPILDPENEISMRMKAFIAQCTVKDRSMRASFDDLKRTMIYRDYSRDDHKTINAPLPFRPSLWALGKGPKGSRKDKVSITDIWLIIANASLQCFNVHPSHAVSNSDSIAELFHVTAGDCLNYCISQAAQKGDGCVSVVFHRKFNTCQLYGHDGTLNGAEVVYLEDHEFYIRSSWDGPCQDKVTPSKGYRQNLHQLQGFPEAAPRSQNQPVQNVPQFESSQFPIDPNPQSIRENVRKAPTNFEIALQQEIERQKMEDDIDIEYATTTIAPKKNNTPEIMTTFKNPTHNYKCQKGEKLAYFMVYGSRLSVKQLPQRLNGVDQSSCLMYCSQNINAIGENIPCYSLNYEPTNEICEMYGKQERDQSTWATLAIDEEHMFGDKFCINSKTDCESETLYPVYLYKVMTKNIISQVPGLNSKVACLAECVDNKDCKAITYKNGMCVLHSASPAEDPTLLSDGSSKTVVIENGCHVSNNQKANRVERIDATEELESSWQEWSLSLLPTVFSEDFRTCFKRVSRRSIGNYAPIAEYRRTALTMCTQHCIMAAGNGPDGGSICKAFTYEVEKQLCKLYDNDGHKIPAVIHPIIGIDIFYRTSDMGECAGPMSGQHMNPNFVKLNNEKNDLKSSLVKTDSVKGSDLPTPGNDQFMQKTKTLASPILKMENMDEVLRSKLKGEDALVPMSEKDTDARKEFEKTDGPLKCKTSSGYYVVVGNEIVLPISGGDVRVYNEVEQGDCAKYCSENKGPDGSSINCRSLNYFPMDRKCELYGILAEPHGTGKLLENEKVIYAEKFCLPESPFICQNDEIFILHVQKTLSKRRRIASESAGSITDCLRKCLDHEDCRSSVFTSSTKKCDLHNVDVSSGDYARDSDHETVLIENGCRRKGVSPKRKSTGSLLKILETSSSEKESTEGWSGCDYKIDGERVRVRTKDDGEMETEVC
ncbi:unnamed protein product [Caenorhabditis sp. 36 PRJEB53466]|nr:unnamed protein product [Caenorhabditis sp. 36 PRJEB53466]